MTYHQIDSYAPADVASCNCGALELAAGEFRRCKSCEEPVCPKHENDCDPYQFEDEPHILCTDCHQDAAEAKDAADFERTHSA